MSQKGKSSDQYKSVFGNRGSGNNGSTERASWLRADSETIRRLIDAASTRGGAVRFGFTRDGGAFALGMYYGQEHVTEYCRPGEDLNIFLEVQTEFFLKLPESGGRSPS